MYKPGAIRKIQVTKFLTHSFLEMLPGPNLNMIVGPNGTGKSAMVAAIIIGLGGNPKVVGRGKKLSDYIQYECQEAKINIWLQSEVENSFIKITREFDRREKTQWKLRDESCPFQDILDCIKHFNIQVDNLCQFLPQDRVVEFAKMNKQELLNATQHALCKENLIEKQVALIEQRNRYNSLTQKITQYELSLQEAEEANSKLEGKIESYNKLKEYEKQMGHIDRKLAWLDYEDIRNHLDTLQSDKKRAQEVYDRHSKAIQPMEQEISKHKKRLDSTIQGNSKLNQEIKNKTDSLDSIIQAMESKKRELNGVAEKARKKLEDSDRIKQLIEEWAKKLEEHKEFQNTLSQKVRQDEQEASKLHADISKLKRQSHVLRESRIKTENDLNNKRMEIKALENEQTRLENVKQERFNKLKQINSDVANAVLWLRNNKHRFRGEIYEPILLEVNMLDSSKAKFLEAIVQKRDYLAFTCTDKSDVGLLIQCLRRDQHFKSINVLFSDMSSEVSYVPRTPIERLRSYGFYAYVNTLFTAPEPVMRYLCKSYRIHEIPVGNEKTDLASHDVPRDFSLFFSENHRYAIRYSNYTKERSSSQSSIRAQRLFSFSLDIMRLETLKGRYNSLRNEVTSLEEMINKLSEAEEKTLKDIKGLGNKLQDYEKNKARLQELNDGCAKLETKIQEKGRTICDPNEVNQRAKRDSKIIVEFILNLQNPLKETRDQIADLFKNRLLNTLEIARIRKKTELMEISIEDTRVKLDEAAEILKTVAEKYKNVKVEAKNLLIKAKELSKGFTPADEGFNEFRQAYDSLDDDPDKLNREKDNLVSKISCLNRADKDEIREYTNRKDLIDKLKQDIRTTSASLTRVTVQMEALQKEWLEPLSELVDAICLRFAVAFERLGCAGEVAIWHGDDPKDFEQYGLAIKVAYRNGQPLQELNAMVQSGGERAVATAAFMLALQELTPVPFRCVDEVNQGMDNKNERLIFELISESTRQPGTAQYFFVTPKLVPKMSYPRELKIHFIYNGPFINVDKKWSSTMFCNPGNFHPH